MVHLSSVPLTVTNAGSDHISPGAENVRKAQIVSEFTKPFELVGLFGAADAGAFGNGQTTEEMDVAGVVATPEASDKIINEATATWVPQKRG